METPAPAEPATSADEGKIASAGTPTAVSDASDKPPVLTKSATTVPRTTQSPTSGGGQFRPSASPPKLEGLVTFDMSGLKQVIDDLQKKLHLVTLSQQSATDEVNALRKENNEIRDNLDKVLPGMRAMTQIDDRMDKMKGELDEHRLVTSERLKRLSRVAEDAAGAIPKVGESAVSADVWEEVVDNSRLAAASIKDLRIMHAALTRSLENTKAEFKRFQDDQSKFAELRLMSERVARAEAAAEYMLPKVDLLERQAEEQLDLVSQVRKSAEDLVDQTKGEMQYLGERCDNLEKDQTSAVTELRQGTLNLKKEVREATGDLDKVREAVTTLVGAQKSFVHNIQQDVETIVARMKAEEAEGEEEAEPGKRSLAIQGLTNALQVYKERMKAVQGNDAVYDQFGDLGSAIAALGLAISKVAAGALDGAGASAVVLRAVEEQGKRLNSEVSSLQSKVKESSAKVAETDTRVGASEAKISQMEEEMEKNKVESPVTWTELERSINQQREASMRDLQATMRRMDELSMQAEMLSSDKMDRSEALSRQMLEKSVGEISTEFAAQLAKSNADIKSVLEEKALQDSLTDVERRFGQRLVQMEAFLMRGVQGLDERASMALMKKADAGLVERLKDKLELFIASMQDVRDRPQSPRNSGVLFRGKRCLVCDKQVVNATDEFEERKRVLEETGQTPNIDRLPTMQPFHNSFVQKPESQRASHNARISKKRQDYEKIFKSKHRRPGSPDRSDMDVENMLVQPTMTAAEQARAEAMGVARPHTAPVMDDHSDGGLGVSPDQNVAIPTRIGSASIGGSPSKTPPRRRPSAGKPLVPSSTNAAGNPLIHSTQIGSGGHGGTSARGSGPEVAT